MAVAPDRADQRVRFHHGQLLATNDLRDDLAYEARMRGLHVRAIHDTWGVALGMEASVDPSAGSVTIAPGFAFDAFGRELLLSQPLVISLPGIPQGEVTGWWFDLLFRAQATPRPANLLEAGDGCLTSGVAPRVERPAWRWLPAGAVTTTNDAPPPLASNARLGAEIPVVRVELDPTGAVGPLDLSRRKRTHGLVRPHIAGGRVHQGSVEFHGSLFDWKVSIGTTDAGFTRQSPVYLVRLVDDPWRSPGSGFAGHLSALTDEVRATLNKSLVGPFVSIVRSEQTSFELHVRTDAVTGVVIKSLWPKSDELSDQPIPVAIDWVGIDPIGGSDQLLTLFKFWKRWIVR